MKLNRLASRTTPSSSEVLAAHRADDERWHIHALNRSEADRQRSLQQELGEMAPAAIGSFHGKALILENARELAAELSSLGPQADVLMKPLPQASQLLSIDDEA